jgi:hypothetical protein
MSQKETDQTSGSQAQKASQVIPDESLLPVSQIKPLPAPVGVALWLEYRKRRPSGLTSCLLVTTSGDSAMSHCLPLRWVAKLLMAKVAS